MPRGVLTVEALKARCKVDPATHCWEWLGASTRNQPRIWTLDYARGEKRVMSGPLASWHIAHGSAPRAGCIVFRGCCNPVCLNPAHLREARTMADVGEHIRRNGARKGTSLVARRANILAAHAKTGTVFTPLAVVQAILAAPRSVTGCELARTHGVSESVVSRYRTGKATGVLVGAVQYEGVSN